MSAPAAMHFLYAYRDDEADGRELRYSLRGLESYWHGPTPEITIVGDLPSWASRVRHIPSLASSDSSTKVRNIMAAVHSGARELALEGVERAVYCDDDYMLLDPTTEVLPLHRGTWADFIRNRNRMWEAGIDWYRDGMNNTSRVLAGVPSELMCFEVHRPMPFSPSKAFALLSHSLSKAPESTPFWRSTYGNVVGWPGEPGPFQARDVRTGGGTYKPGTAWVSTDQKYWDRINRKLDEMLPSPSRWEQ